MESMPVPMPDKIEVVPWDTIEDDFISQWGRPDGEFDPEHLSIVGPTGSGKSLFQTYVLKKRAEIRGSYVVIIATKPADRTMQRMNWPIVHKWPPPWGKHEQVIFWPKPQKGEFGYKSVQLALAHMLQDIWVPRANRIVVFDEIAFVEQELRLAPIVNRYWREARSLGITIVANTQRPRNVSRYMWSEPAWAVAFRPDDEDEARRVSEFLGSRRKYLPALMELAPHQFLMVRRRKREAVISKLVV